MITADEIREYVLVALVKPARRRNQSTLTFTSGSIHKGMGLKNRFPAVCSAVGTSKFHEFASVTLVSRDGPPQSNTVKWVFDIK